LECSSEERSYLWKHWLLEELIADVRVNQFIAVYLASGGVPWFSFREGDLRAEMDMAAAKAETDHGRTPTGIPQLADPIPEEVPPVVVTDQQSPEIVEEPPPAVVAAAPEVSTEDDRAIDLIRRSGLDWVGPNWRSQRGISEDVIDRLVAAGRLRLHPSLLGLRNVGILRCDDAEQPNAMVQEAI